jgi:hypothetical protein
VKLLRKCITQLQGKVEEFVRGGIQFEKDAAAQAESLKLAAESARRQLELEVSHVRRDAAQIAASHKAAAAAWQSDLDSQKAEVGSSGWEKPQGIAFAWTGTTHGVCWAIQVGRVKRELERIQVERDRAREDFKRFVCCRFQ